jgi:hypothetical protein
MSCRARSYKNWVTVPLYKWYKTKFEQMLVHNLIFIIIIIIIIITEICILL